MIELPAVKKRITYYSFCLNMAAKAFLATPNGPSSLNRHRKGAVIKNLVGSTILLLLLTSCSTPKNTASVPGRANVEGLWTSLSLITEACGETYTNDNTEVKFDFLQKGTFLSATVTMKSEVVGGTSVHEGTFRGSLNPSDSIGGVLTIEKAPAGDVPEPPFDINVDLQLSGTLLAGALLHKGGAYCLGGRWEDAKGTIVLKKQ